MIIPGQNADRYRHVAPPSCSSPTPAPPPPLLRWRLHAVVLRNPRILILDEATASLDSRSELIIQQALDEMMVRFV